MNEHKFIEEALLIPQDPVELPETRIPDYGILLERTYYQSGTHGVLTFSDGTKFYTLENPWLDNQRRISCVPEGIYKMGMHNSPLVTRLTGGDYTRAWEVLDVKDRTYILVHQGNYTKDTAGCILVGLSSDFQGAEPVVWRSREAFDMFMEKMSQRDSWQILIQGRDDGIKKKIH